MGSLNIRGVLIHSSVLLRISDRWTMWIWEIFWKKSTHLQDTRTRTQWCLHYSESLSTEIKMQSYLSSRTDETLASLWSRLRSFGSLSTIGRQFQSWPLVFSTKCRFSLGRHLLFLCLQLCHGLILFPDWCRLLSTLTADTWPESSTGVSAETESAFKSIRGHVTHDADWQFDWPFELGCPRWFDWVFTVLLLHRSLIVNQCDVIVLNALTDL